MLAHLLYVKHHCICHSDETKVNVKIPQLLLNSHRFIDGMTDPLVITPKGICSSEISHHVSVKLVPEVLRQCNGLIFKGQNIQEYIPHVS